MKTIFMQATASDKEEILRLYKSQIGREYCPWDEHYPGTQEIDYDLSREALFIIKNEQNEIVGAVSMDMDAQVEALTCWSEELYPGAELARLTVRVDCQNQGLARELIKCGMKELKERGYKSIHFLVNKHNLKALRAYAHLEFRVVGECFMYEQPFLCYEKEI